MRGIKKIIDQFIEEVNILYLNKFDYSKFIYQDSHTKGIIKCNDCLNIFERTPSQHLNGIGCTKCNSITYRNKMSKYFLEQAKLIHGEKFDYIECIYINSKTKINIMCNICKKKFYQTPDNHINNKRGCRNCANNEMSIKRKKTAEQFIKEAILIHKNKFDYSEINNSIYLNKDTKIPIICNKCLCRFYQTPRNHLAGNGCPDKCSSGVSISQIEWLDYLNIHISSRNLILKVNGRIFKPDAYVVETNTIYEFYGDYWHGNPDKFELNEINSHSKKYFYELYQSTLEKENYLKSNGYNIISIWEKDWIIQKKLKTKDRI